MQKQLKNLLEFQKAFNCPWDKNPTTLPEDEWKLRGALAQEELEEYKTACINENHLEILDSLVDQAYILFGTVVAHGLQDVFEAAFEEVHRSNMAKLVDGKPLINGVNAHDDTRPQGKVLKPEGWTPPNLKQFL